MEVFNRKARTWTVLNPENVRMGTCFKEKKHKLFFELFPHQEPVGLYMALPAAGILSVEFVLAVSWRQLLAFGQYLSHFLELGHVEAAFLASNKTFCELWRICN